MLRIGAREEHAVGAGWCAHRMERVVNRDRGRDHGRDARRRGEPDQRLGSRNGVETEVPMRVIVIRRIRCNHVMRRDVSSRSVVMLRVLRVLRVLLVLRVLRVLGRAATPVSLRQVLVHLPVRQRQHGSRKAPHEGNGERDQAKEGGLAHDLM